MEVKMKSLELYWMVSVCEQDVIICEEKRQKSGHVETTGNSVGYSVPRKNKTKNFVKSCSLKLSENIMLYVES